MFKKNFICSLSILVLAAICIPVSAAGDSVGKKKLKVFILAGQSNMVGHAKISTFDYIGDDPGTAAMLGEMIDNDGKGQMVKDTWISYYQAHKANDPAGEGFGQLTAGYGARKNPTKLDDCIGPEFTFGIYMQKEINEPILIIKTAWGGKSLFMDFRPPSAGTFDLSETEATKIKQKGGDPKAERAKRIQGSGHYYQLMIAHVNHVLKDIKRVCPAYDEKMGYEIAGFVWFQGWNDMVNSNVYPNRDKKGGYETYSELLAMFIDDVRKDLKNPTMPFVIGVMGVNGPIEKVEKRYRNVHGNFREAMAAPAKFKSNVIAVQTAPFWDMKLDELKQKKDQYNYQIRLLKNKVKKGELTPEQFAAEEKNIQANALSDSEEKTLKRGASNGGYHYLGCAKTMGLIGKAFAQATVQMQ